MAPQRREDSSAFSYGHFHHGPGSHPDLAHQSQLSQPAHGPLGQGAEGPYIAFPEEQHHFKLLSLPRPGMPSQVLVVEGRDVRAMVEAGLARFPEPEQETVVIKPNLIIDRPGPTTPVDVVEAVATHYLPEHRVVVAEGSGWCETWEAFTDLGYLALKTRYGVELVDLNYADTSLLERPDALVLKRFELPEVLRGAYLISLALLKTHSLTGVSLSMKNMLGVAKGELVPAGKKRRFHKLGIHESIVDICAYRMPDLAIIDGRSACVGGELGGRLVPYGAIIFSDDPVAADAVGAHLLGLDPMSIRHLRLAHELGLGTADLDQIRMVRLRA